MENGIKTQQHKIIELKQEEQALSRVSEEQQLAYKTINREGDYEDKIQEMNDQLRSYKKQYRQIYYEQVEDEKKLIQKHDNLV